MLMQMVLSKCWLLLGTSLVAQVVKNLPEKQETQVWSWPIQKEQFETWAFEHEEFP